MIFRLISLSISLFFILPLVIIGILFWPFQFFFHDLQYLMFSVFFAFFCGILALIFGIPLAIVASHDGILSRILNTTILLPMFFPISIAGTLFYQLFLNISGIFGIEGRGTLWGLLVTHVFYEIPLVVFYVSLALRNLSHMYISLMMTDGISVWQQYRMALRLVLPQIVQAFMLVFLYVFQSTNLILLLGFGKFHTLESRILIAVSHENNISYALGLSLLQILVLSTLFIVLSRYYGNVSFLCSFRVKPSFPVLYRHPLFLGITITFCSLLLVWISPLILGFWGHRDTLWRLSQKFSVFESFRNSFIISVLTSLCCVVCSELCTFGRKKYVLALLLSVPQVIYYMGVSLWGNVFGLPLLIQALWGMSLGLLPFMWFFLMATTVSDDKSIVQSARLDGAKGFYLWKSIYWPLRSQRWISVFWKGVLLVFGNFSLSYIISEKGFPMASALLVELTRKRQIALVNSFSLFIVIIMSLVYLIFIQERGRSFQD